VAGDVASPGKRRFPLTAIAGARKLARYPPKTRQQASYADLGHFVGKMILTAGVDGEIEVTVASK
jgi:hypothetical protein